MTEYRPLNTSPLPVKLRVQDYLLLDERGAFEDYSQTELIEGKIFAMNAQHRPHGMVKMELYDVLRDALRTAGSMARPVTEFSLDLSPDSMPRPDILITIEPRGEGAVPRASVLLVIEVSDATLEFDLGRKSALYAAHHIPEYWVADVNARVIHQLWKPDAGAYGETRTVAFGESIAAVTIDTLAIDTRSL